MAIKKNPDWSVWLADVWHWARQPPGIYICIIILLAGGLFYSSSQNSPASVVVVTRPPVIPQSIPLPVATSPECNGIPTEYTYSAQTTYRINENFCQLRGYVKSGCVSWLDSTRATLAHTCNGPLPSVPGITLLRADTEAVVRLNHCRNLAPGNLLDACR